MAAAQTWCWAFRILRYLTKCYMRPRKRNFSEHSVSLSDEPTAKRVRFNSMVGVPRSKGCRMCVQRRVKCDQTRPFCNRCIKGSRECPGYEPSIKFQDEGPKLRELYKHDTSEQFSGQPSTHQSSEDPHFEYSTAVPLTLRLNVSDSAISTPGDEHGSTPQSFETALLIAVMSPTVSQAQLLSSFISTLSTQTTPALQPTFPHTALFLKEVANRASQSPVLEWAIRAVALSHLGRQMSDKNLVQLSRQMYRQALLTLNAALQSPTQGLASETLAATILLSFYEVLTCTEKDSWVRHAGGAAHLIRLRGPDRHRAGLGRAAFLAYRHSLIIESFLSNTPSFLAEQSWVELSREIQKSTPTTDRDPIFDRIDDFYLISVELPGFTQSVRDTNNSSTPAMRKKLLAVGYAHRGNLKVLYKRIMATLSETGQYSVTEHPSTTGDEVFPAALHFPSLTVGSLLVSYWAILSVLNRSCALLETNTDIGTQSSSGDAITAPAADMETPPRPRYLLRRTASSELDVGSGSSSAADLQEENLQCARAICKSAEALAGSAFLGPLYLIFALRVAYHTFTTGNVEREWVKERLEDISAQLGIARTLVDGRDDATMGEDELEPGDDEQPEEEQEQGEGKEIRRDSTSHARMMKTTTTKTFMMEVYGGGSSAAARASASASHSPEQSRRPSLQVQQQLHDAFASGGGGGGAGPRRESGVSLRDLELARGAAAGE